MLYVSATAAPETLHRAPIAVIDEDQSQRSQRSQRIISAFYPPSFLLPAMVNAAEADHGMDEGRYSFELQIPLIGQTGVNKYLTRNFTPEYVSLPLAAHWVLEYKNALFIGTLM